MRLRLFSLLSAFSLVAAIAGPAAGLVPCAKVKTTTGEIKEGAAVKLRTACNSGEVQIDPSSVGLDGPQVGARVFNSAPIPVPSATDVTLPFDSERWDTADLHDSGMPSRLTAPVDGTYMISCGVSFPTNNSGTVRKVVLRRNGVEEIAVEDSGVIPSAHTEVTATVVFRLSAGEYIEAHVGHDASGTLNVVGYPSLISPECAMALLR